MMARTGGAATNGCVETFVVHQRIGEGENRRATD
jgi:hypothetical protein